MNVKLFNASLLTACVLLASASPVNAIGYKLTDLGTLGGRTSMAFSINDSGQVVGWSDILGDSASHATIWNGTTPTDLGTLGGNTSLAFSINNSGQVVGGSTTSASSGWHATIWNGTTPTDLGTLGGNYSNSSATGINDSGQVVGYSFTPNTLSHPTQFHATATIWNGTTPTELGTLGGNYSSSATGINDSGQVVGYYSTLGDSAAHATIWNGTTPTDLGNLGGIVSWAFSINDSGQVVGSSFTLGDYAPHATIWNGTTLTDLGTLGGRTSTATGINNAGQVVGWSDILGDSALHATIWNGTTPIDLNSFLSVSDVNAGWVLQTANAINDNGWIVGGGFVGRSDYKHHAFLLTPCPTCTSAPFPHPPIPEPETYALFMAGLGLMGFIARRRKNSQA